MPDRVVDASVIAAMVFEEPRADEAEDLLRDATLFASEILPYELASVALKKSRGLPSGQFDIASRLRAEPGQGVGRTLVRRFQLQRAPVFGNGPVLLALLVVDIAAVDQRP